MKKIIFSLLLALAICFATAVSAQDYSQNTAYKTALGVRLSNTAPMVNNSITLKHFLNERTAVEALFSFGEPLA
ncbi:MAG TPA: hypothetical protein VI461_16675, partial [Chitinophagaceae bacterium]|nr:hypothetical protein [Chitinophagaceae bacterium]